LARRYCIAGSPFKGLIEAARTRLDLPDGGQDRILKVSRDAD
jgi:hypothetical protein